MSSKKAVSPSEKQFYVASVAPEELSDYMFVISMVLGATAMFVKVRTDQHYNQSLITHHYYYYYYVSIAY